MTNTDMFSILNADSAGYEPPALLDQYLFRALPDLCDREHRGRHEAFNPTHYPRAIPETR
jgi:hypothetical protein